MSGRIALPEPCPVGEHEPVILHRSGGASAKLKNACGKCGQEIYRATETGAAGDHWATADQRRPRNHQRVYGTVLCLGCNCEVLVVYPYTNSDRSLGLIDHFDAPGHRCPHAGLSIWDLDLGWTEERFRQRYGEASISKAPEPPAPPLSLLQEAAERSSRPIDGQSGFDGTDEEPPPADDEDPKFLPCQNCGGREFKIAAVYDATDTILVSEDGDDFEMLDTRYGDGEWEDMASVRCVVCDHIMEYQDWTKRERTNGQQNTDDAGSAGNDQE
jgi:hypothetical protein